MSASRRAKYTESTRQALLQSARRLFGSQGYGVTSLEEIARQEDLTKGAVYHHFKNKEVMFEAVMEEMLEEAMKHVSESVAAISSPQQQALVAIDLFLDICLQTEYQQIVLRDGPSVLGWTRWKDMEKRYTYALIENLIHELRNEHLMEDRPVDMLVRFIFAWIIEVALMMAETEDKAKTRQQAKLFLADLLRLTPN